MYTGATHFNHFGAQVINAREIKFGIRVKTTKLARFMGWQDTLGTNHAQGLRVTNEQVIAIGIKLVDIKTIFIGW